MKTFRLSKRAKADLDDIFDYSLETFGLDKARAYSAGLAALLAQLVSGERSGRTVDDVRPGLLRYNHVSHAIFFRNREDGIFIVRILHQRRDFKRHL